MVGRGTRREGKKGGVILIHRRFRVEGTALEKKTEKKGATDLLLVRQEKIGTSKGRGK